MRMGGKVRVYVGWTGQKGQGAGKKYIKGSEDSFFLPLLFFFFLFSFMVVELLTDQRVVT